MYRFVGNDPVQNIDKWGLCAPPQFEWVYHGDNGEDGADGWYLTVIDSPCIFDYINTNINYVGGGNNQSSGGGSSSGGGTGGGAAQKKNWKPNKEDCDKLSQDWGSYINAVPDKTRFTSSEEAAVGALIHTMLNYQTTSREWGGNIYSDWSLWKSPSLHFGTHYFFSSPQIGGDIFVTIKNTVSFWQTREGTYHTHPIVLTGKWKDHIPLYDEFSPDDKLGAWGRGVDEFMGNETGSFLKWQSTGDPRGVTMDRDDNVAGGYFPGQQSTITGAPSKEEFTKIKACRDANLL